MDFFNGLKTARECLLELSLYRAQVRRIRCLPSGVLIEIDQPLETESKPEIKNGYAAVEFGGCQLVWKLQDQE